MAIKRIFTFMMTLVLACSIFPVTAEELGNTPSQDYEIPEAEETVIPDGRLLYTGGAVRRFFPKDTEVSSLLSLGYTMTDAPYVVMGMPLSWDVYISGGTSPYNISVNLAHQTLDMDPFADYWYMESSFTLDGDSFTHVFTKEGRYFWEFQVTDAEGQALYFQTRIYEAYADDDETDETTTVGKANAIVAELITDDMSDYARARALHDWLIYNANYDFTYTKYDASGVLLEGSGVCDSYARAYLMLCTAAGLECMYVSGTAGSDANPANWGNHAWNLVRLNGSWYHVDCTWDDPGTGGSEQHVYFCVNDETMAKDHRWNRPDDLFDVGGMLVPDAEGGELEAEEDGVRDYDFTFASLDEYQANMDALVEQGLFRAKTVGLYTGDQDLSELWGEFKTWVADYAIALAGKGLVTSYGSAFFNEYFTISLGWKTPDEYVRIHESTARISVGETYNISVAESYPTDALVGEWMSSDTSVATVAAAYDASNGLHAVVTGVGAGTAVITVTTGDGLSDSITVTVLAPHQPDLDLTLTTSENGVKLTWNSIPGVTECEVMRVSDGVTASLGVVSACNMTIGFGQLSANAQHSLYLVARRVIGGETVVSYTSNRVSYCRYEFNYEATLPADTTEIGVEAFLNNSSITSVYVKDSVTTIGSRAFAGCTNLYVVRIPESVGSIGAGAFDGCSLRFAEVSEGSYADTWMAENYPDVVLIH